MVKDFFSNRVDQQHLFLLSVPYKDGSTGRRSFIKTTGSAAVASLVTSVPFAASAEVIVPEQFTSYDFPSDWGLSFNYEQDAAKVRNHMVTATGLGKGADRMEDYGKNMKKEMVDFVSYYRRFPNVAGKPSFSTLYTSINVLAGHYTSYGYKYPLPEKRVSFSCERLTLLMAKTIYPLFFLSLGSALTVSIFPVLLSTEKAFISGEFELREVFHRNKRSCCFQRCSFVMYLSPEGANFSVGNI